MLLRRLNTTLDGVTKRSSWDGIVGLLNVILVVNTLLFSIEMGFLGLVQPKSELTAWQRSWLDWFWHSFAFAVGSQGATSVVGTCFLAIVSFIDASDEAKLNNFKGAFKYSLIGLSVITVFSFWAIGFCCMSAVAYVTDEKSHMRPVIAYLNGFSVSTFLYLIYVACKLRFIFSGGTSEETELSTETQQKIKPTAEMAGIQPTSIGPPLKPHAELLAKAGFDAETMGKLSEQTLFMALQAAGIPPSECCKIILAVSTTEPKDAKDAPEKGAENWRCT